jgi:acetyl esterase/lipase
MKKHRSENMKTETMSLYEDKKGVTLTSYILEPSGELMGNRKRPAVLVCPGGAYLMCSDREAEPVALRFAAMGYHAFVIRYSTYFMDGDFNFDFTQAKPKPDVIYPAPLRDIGKAVLRIKECAEEWHVDADKIIIAGGSAGGHLGALYATSWHKPVLSDYFKRPAEDFKPAAAVIFYPVTDYFATRQFFASSTDQKAQGLFMMANMAFMGTHTPSDELLEELSPARQVSEKTPPMFIWATGQDELVPPQQTLLMGIALADKGIPFEMHLFEEGPHGLSLATQASAGAKNQLNADTAKWIDLADAWLLKRFALDMPAEPPEVPDAFRTGVRDSDGGRKMG